MADEDVNDTITRLRAKLSLAEANLLEERTAKATLQGELTKATKRADDYDKLVKDHDSLKGEFDGLKGSTAFAAAAAKAKVNPEMIDDLKAILKFGLADGPAVDKLDSAIADAIEKRAYFKAKTKEEGLEEDASKGTEKPAPPAMQRGEGYGRGNGMNAKTQSFDETVNKAFAATGRTNAFKI